MEDRLNVIESAVEAIYNTTVSNEQRTIASQVSLHFLLLSVACLVHYVYVFLAPILNNDWLGSYEFHEIRLIINKFLRAIGDRIYNYASRVFE